MWSRKTKKRISLDVDFSLALATVTSPFLQKFSIKSSSHFAVHYFITLPEDEQNVLRMINSFIGAQGCRLPIRISAVSSQFMVPRTSLQAPLCLLLRVIKLHHNKKIVLCFNSFRSCFVFVVAAIFVNCLLGNVQSDILCLGRFACLDKALCCRYFLYSPTRCETCSRFNKTPEYIARYSRVGSAHVVDVSNSLKCGLFLASVFDCFSV